MSEFYRAFEDKHRGSRQLILDRLTVYKPFIEKLSETWDLEITDLGCGRGEWLELLTSLPVRCHGVDLDGEMLAACRQRGFTVTESDAITYLKELPDASQMAVSAFHLVEHIPFDQLQVLVKEAKRVLVPGGLLILETPNPENLIVGTSSFHMDPTHVNPIPPPLLQFLPDYYGYSRSAVLRLQEPTSIQDIAPITLMHVFNGVSPDYAVVAQTPCIGEIRPDLDALFAADFGVTLDGLANAYEGRISGIEEGTVALGASVASISEHAAACDTSLAILHENAAGQGTSLSILHENAAAHGTTLAELQNRTAVHESDIASLQTDSVIHQTSITGLEEHAVADRNVLVELKQEIAALQRSHQIHWGSLDLEIRELRADNARVLLEISRNEQQLGDMHSLVHAQERHIAVINQQLDIAQSRSHAIRMIIPSPLLSSIRYVRLQRALLKRDGFKSRAKFLVRKVVFFAIRKVSPHKRMKRVGVFTLKKMGAYDFFYRRYHTSDIPIFRPAVDPTVSFDTENLSVHAQTVLDKFKLAEKTRDRTQ